MNPATSTKLSSALLDGSSVALRIWRATLSSAASHSHQGEGNKGGADSREMNPPIEDPENIKKMVPGGDNGAASTGSTNTTTSDDDDDSESLFTDDERASTLLKDQSGGQDQTSS